MIRICGTFLVAAVGLVNLCCCTTQEAQENMISNASFEDESGSFWSFSERTSRWSVKRRPLSTSSENVRYSRRNSRTGRSSLLIEPWTKKADRTLFLSQYGTLHAASSRNDAPLVLELWSFGKDSKNLKINFDISYRDNIFMFVEANPIENENNSSVFFRTCIFIPSYGSVKSFMFHLIVDTTIRESIYIDDVSLRFASSGRLYSDCLLYVDSFPVQRFVLNDFLKPPSNAAGNSKITLAVQLAKDQLDMLEQTAATWKGPISAALLLFGEPGGEQLSQIVERYYESETLSTYATLHIVWEDRVNGKDVSMYPSNALANIAIAHSTTDYVFFLDVDVHPTSSESGVWKELSKSIERATVLTQRSEHCQRCAFAAPLFDRASRKIPGFPKTKDELKKRVEDPTSDIQVRLLPSHSSVDYHRWFAVEGSYEIEYSRDSELYLVVPSTAPLMNDLYGGGRDRRAYGRDLHAAGFRFFVLDEVFVVSLSDPPRSVNGIARRSSEDVPSRLFLNIDFHDNDLEHGYLRYPASYSAKFIPKTSQLGNIHAEHTHTVKDENNDHLADGHKNIERSSDQSESDESANGKDDNRKNTPLPEINDKISENDGEGGMGCKDALSDLTFSLIPDMNSGKSIPAGRIDMMLESLMQTYGTFTYIEIPSATAASRFGFALQLMQPEAAIAILPQQETEKHTVDGIFENYRLRATGVDALEIVSAQHPGRKLFSLNSEGLSEERAVEFSNALLRHASDGDVILIELRDEIKSDSFWSALFADMCAVRRRRSDWKIYRKREFAVMKSRFLRKPSPEQLPEVPRCHADFRPRSGFTTDVILFSKNRPLQTFAFMDSLKNFVTGLNKVWLLVKTEGAIFDSGYELVADCFSTFVQVEIVKESKKSGSFGQQLLDVIRSSSADSIMIAVDEIIWLRPVDLSVVSSMLYDCRDAASFQLRLGDDLRILATSNYPDRFAPFRFDSDYVAFYPRRLPYDFGYVLNVDGLVLRRLDLIADFEGFVGRCRTPGCVEQGWIVHRLHHRSRQWHLMYRYSRMVNNMGMVDGRVADRRGTPAEGSYELARILVEERRRIDVERFAAENRNHFATHQKLPVYFVPIEC